MRQILEARVFDNSGFAFVRGVKRYTADNAALRMNHIGNKDSYLIPLGDLAVKELRCAVHLIGIFYLNGKRVTTAVYHPDHTEWR